MNLETMRDKQRNAMNSLIRESADWSEWAKAVPTIATVRRRAEEYTYLGRTTTVRELAIGLEILRRTRTST